MDRRQGWLVSLLSSLRVALLLVLSVRRVSILQLQYIAQPCQV